MVNNIFGGLLFTSDDISAYSEKTMRAFRSMFPFVKKEIDRVDELGALQKVTFRIGMRDYIAYINLSSRKCKTVLDDGLYFCNTVEEARPLHARRHRDSLRPHESRCYHLVSDDFFTVAGTTGHIFPGSEIVSCIQKGDIINVAQYRPGEKRKYRVRADARAGPVPRERENHAGHEDTGEAFHARN